MTVRRHILRLVGWGIGGAVVVLFLFSYAAPYLPPEMGFWWADLLAVFLPVLSLVVGVVAAGVVGWGMYRRQWDAVVVAVVLLGLIGLRFGPSLSAWGPNASKQGGLRVMSFNIPPGADREGGVVAQVVQREDPDVLAIQESTIRTTRDTPGVARWMSSSIRPLLDSMAYAVPQTLPSGTKIQQPVVGRIELDSLTVHPLPPNGTESERSRFTRTVFTWQGRTAVLYNLHLHSVARMKPWLLGWKAWMSRAVWRSFLASYREGALRRAQQARQIRRRLEQETHPVLVVGDFNSTRHQWAYRHIAQGLQNGVQEQGSGWSATYPVGRPLVRIDHILAGPDWAVQAARVASLDGLEAASDHRPVVVRLTWQDAPHAEASSTAGSFRKNGARSPSRADSGTVALDR